MREQLDPAASHSTIQNVLAAAAHRLTTAGCQTPRLDAEVLLAHSLNRDRAWLYAHLPDPLDPNERAGFEALLQRRQRREPVAYITGHKQFFALDFHVNQHVLIPRPETELLVETALQSINNYQLTINKLQSAIRNPQSPTPSLLSPLSLLSSVHIADVGTGSGCIAIALAKHLPGAALCAIDLSPEALELAGQNAARHGVADRIEFRPGHLLEPLARPVDLIVSNPPYVKSSQLASAATWPEVSRYEPALALDGGPDGLELIRQLLLRAGQKLKPGGSLLVEIGADQGQAARHLARRHFPRAQLQIKKDLAGLDRLLVVTNRP